MLAVSALHAANASFLPAAQRTFPPATPPTLCLLQLFVCGLGPFFRFWGFVKEETPARRAESLHENFDLGNRRHE
jgi:hypothetical protein